MDYTKKAPVDLAQSSRGRHIGVSAYDSPGTIKEKLAAAGVDVSGLRVRKLSWDEIEQMRDTPEELYHMHEFGNAANWNKAIEDHDRIIAEIRADEKKKHADGLVEFFKDLYESQKTGKAYASPENAQLLRDVTETVGEFAKKYPQFKADGSVEKIKVNYDTATDYISNALLDPTAESSWATALSELSKRGRIVINDGEGNLLSGQALAEHPNLPDLLLPVQTRAQKKAKRTRDEIARMTSDEFYNSRTPEEKEDIERGKYLPGIYDKRQQQQQTATDKQRDKEMAAFMSLTPSWPGTEEASTKVLELLNAWGERLTQSSLQACYRHLCNIGEITPLQSTDQRYGNARFVFGDGKKIHQHGQAVPTNIGAKNAKTTTIQRCIDNHSSLAFQTRLERDPVFRDAVNSGNTAVADSEE